MNLLLLGTISKESAEMLIKKHFGNKPANNKPELTVVTGMDDVKSIDVDNSVTFDFQAPLDTLFK